MNYLKNNCLKRSIIILAILTLVFTNLFSLWSNVFAATDNKNTVVNGTSKTNSESPTKATSTTKSISVDEKGFDSQGRMVANYGSPIVDGIVDAVWSSTPVVKPKYVASNVSATAAFRTLWDDNALYILAEVKDSNLSVQSVNPYMQDSLEIFLDENNDKTQEYGIDDLHLRVNYENFQSVDVGNIERFYTNTKKTNDGYLVEARVSLKSKPVNEKVLGIDLQINDAKAGDRLGTINVFDSTGSAWNDTKKFGEVILTGKIDGTVSGLNPYDLMNLVKIAQKLDPKRYINASVLIDAINNSEKVLADTKVTQNQIDDQYTALKAAISQLVLTDEAANDKEFKAVPEEYKTENKKQGTIESLEYTTANLNNGTDIKKLNVYLPYGYNATDTNKKYNILYLMHGGGENENTIFGGPGQNKELKKILDNMIANGDIEPLIVVTPTFYGGKGDIATFHEELMAKIIPLVENKYHTYTASVNPKDLEASRDHRAFGGFSMGSATTWYIYINCLKYFKYYIPLSGDCWALGQGAGGSKSQQTAEYLAKIAKDAGYKPNDYYLFCATGLKDIAYSGLKLQVDAMKELKNSFIYSSNIKKGNFYFIVGEDGTHAWNWINQYIYDILPDLFKN